MNRTTTIATGLICSALWVMAPAVAEEPYPSTGRPSDTLVQPPTTRQDLDRTLSEARAALEAGRYEQAASLLARAERSEVRYPRLHFGDTPAKLRRDYNAAVAGSPASTRAKLPGLNLLGKKEPGTATDPFLQSFGSGGDIGQQLTGIGNPFRNSGATEGEPPVSPREASDRALIGARQALTVGDRARAEQYLALARELGVAYEPGSDSPQKIAEAIGSLEQIEQLKQRENGREAWRLAYARFLVAQADALLAWNDLETAAQAATDAKSLDADLSNDPLQPDDLLTRIAKIRGGEEAIAATSTRPPTSIAAAKQETLRLLAQARKALAAGDLTAAQNLAGQASQLNVADRQFGPEEDSPAKLAADLQRTMLEDPSVEEATAELALNLAPARDGLLLETPAPLPLPTVRETAAEDIPLEGDSNLGARQLLSEGETALRSGDRSAALRFFREAFKRKEELDVLSQQRLQGHLQMLSVGVGSRSDSEAGSLLSEAGDRQNVLARQVFNDVTKLQAEASRLREKDPYRSQEVLEEARKLVETSGLDDATKGQLLSRVNLSLEATARYIADHKSELDLDAANQAVLDEIDREQKLQVKVSQEVAELVDQFNALIDEHRDAEAEVIAKKLYEIAPDELVAQQIWRQAKMIRRHRQSASISNDSEEGVAGVLLDSRRTTADALAGMTRDYAFGDNWLDIKSRTSSGDRRSRRTARELEIEEKLKTNVLPTYDELPLAAVIEALGELADVNMHLDPRGLSQEGVRTDTPVSLNLKSEISLKSALQLILEPLHLTYQIKDEVLKVTSEEIRDGEVYTEVYNVADLVVPIPNFVPTSNIGLQGLIEDAYRSMGYGPGGGAPGPMTLVNGGPNGTDQLASTMSDNVLANPLAGGQGNPGTPFGAAGPGGPGGAAQADFDSLIDLIVSTVEYDSWMENGTGEGEIQPFPTNLSLVISQTQRVHEQIRDLLEQLRRLQDLQVTIEVRFIRLTDSFFERIGLDFDFNIEDGTGISTTPGVPGALFPGGPVEPNVPSAAVGITDPPSEGFFPNFTVDLDLPVRQSSFGLATPSFGTPATVGSFGFAILSDIEAYFVLEASQGDRRANVLQAPKVTLFNGQQATVVDSAFVPFVISVIPVVGEFAAAQQPVIVVLSEGTMMTVQAVVSDDRRYVRLTLVPFFSQIGEVREFTFDGSETVQNSSNTTDDDGDGNDESDQNSQQTIRSGTTVQLPTFEIISVATTVSVPDGGTVLLGGIKRLREGRNEFGVPLLSKIPYVDRLFRNVGIGRETDSLMMMVTPHIIIQEEEEERLGLTTE